MKNPLLLLASLAIAAIVAGCGGSSQGSSADPPADFKVVAGDGVAVATWKAEEGVDYWLFYGPGSDITTANWVSSGGRVITRVTSPRIVTGLFNGVTYSFTINGRKDGGPGGPGAPTQVVTPRLSGSDWTVGTPLGTDRLNGVAGGVTVSGFVRAVGGKGGALYSGLGTAGLTQATNPSAPVDINGVIHAPSGLLTVGAGGGLLFSLDGVTWTAVSTGITNNLLGGTSNGANFYVVVGEGGAIVTSTGGSTWTTAPSNTANKLYSAGYGNGRYVVVGAAGTLLTSTDAATWTTVAPLTSKDLRAVAYGAFTNAAAETVTLWVAVGAGGTILTSSDGLAWTAKTPFTTGDLNGLIYATQFVAVGSKGAIFTSTDGSTWLTRNSGTTSDLTSVARTQTGYLAVGDQGTNVTSD